MGFLERLLGEEEPQESIHAFGAAMREYLAQRQSRRGAALTAQPILDYFDIQPGTERNAAQALLADLEAGTITPDEVEMALILGAEKSRHTGASLYSVADVKARLGF